MHVDKAFEMWNNPNEVLTKEEAFKAGYSEAWWRAKEAARDEMWSVVDSSYSDGIEKGRCQGFVATLVGFLFAVLLLMYIVSK